MNAAYYDVTVCGIAIGDAVYPNWLDKRLEDIREQIREEWITDPDALGSCGLSVNPIDRKILLRVVEELGGDKPPFDLKVQDNGNGGDGLQISIGYEMSSAPSHEPLVWFVVPDDAIEVLIQSLQAVLNLRKAQKEA